MSIGRGNLQKVTRTDERAAGGRGRPRFDGAIVRRNAAVVIDGHADAASCRAASAVDDGRSRLRRRVAGAGLHRHPGERGGDVLFNDSPTPEGNRHHRSPRTVAFGTTGLLPTLISDTPEKMRAGAPAVDAIMVRDPGVLGIHRRGRFCPLRGRAFTIFASFVSLSAKDAALLTASRQGVTLVTLAPEQVPGGFIAGARSAVAPCPASRSAIPWRPTRRRTPHGGRAHRLHAPVQCHAAARESRSRADSRRSRRRTRGSG